MSRPGMRVRRVTRNPPANPRGSRRCKSDPDALSISLETTIDAEPPARQSAAHPPALEAALGGIHE